ncbi:MAG: hypothetical protein AAF754_11870 [Pseudomonadota bacterium]
MLKKSHISLYCCLLAIGCAPQYIETTADSPQDVPARRAIFATNPAGLDTAFKDGCSSPGDTITRPNARTLRCNIVPTPQSAAFLLLEFDAKLEPPKMVVEKVTRQLSDCVLVEFSYFAEITAKSGKPQRVYIPNRSLDRRLDQILRASGGSVDVSTTQPECI